MTSGQLYSITLNQVLSPSVNIPKIGELLKYLIGNYVDEEILVSKSDVLYGKD